VRNIQRIHKIFTASLHTAGYLALTSTAIWMLFRFAP
jgi:hypothetical protein